LVSKSVFGMPPKTASSARTRKRPARSAARSGAESDCQSDGSEAEIDCAVWRLQARLGGARGVQNLMPAVQAWASPPSASKPHPLTGLAPCTRKVFACSGNAPFWCPASATPTNVLEEFALDVFWFHVGRLGWTAEAVARLGPAAGAEWWVQRRVSTQPKSERGVGWHYDKDEDLLDDSGLLVHPLVATATYLTGRGAPLVVLTRPTLARSADGEPQPEEPDLGSSRSEKEAFLAFPAPGLHVAFQGALLHGVVSSHEACRGERLSLLLNIWLRHRPMNLQRCSLDLGRPSGRSPRKRTRAGTVVRIRSHRGGAPPASTISLTPDVGSWTLHGLNLPGDLSPQGVWRVPQCALSVSDGQKGLKRQRGT